MEITGHDIGTGWTVVHNPPAVELQAVTIWLTVWVLVLTVQNDEFFAQQLRPSATNVPL